LDLKSSQFRKEREKSWRELERILRAVEDRGFLSLSAVDLHRLPVLYRGTVSSLSVARAISLDRNLLEYLEALVSRAYLCLYSNKRFTREVLVEFFTRRFPGAVCLFWKPVAAAAGLLALGFLCGFVLTLEDMERYPSFIPEMMAQGRNPASSTESLREVLYDSKHRKDGLTLFASFLFTNNAKVGILCFSLGFAAGLLTALLLLYNGLALGAMTALYHSRGLGGEFLAWVMGHGVTELGAVALCGGAGLALGGALLFPGRRRRLDSLAHCGRNVASLVIGAVVMFLAAALLEGYFRNLVHSVEVRWSVAAASLGLWVSYFLVIGRRSGKPLD
jgi:uncharacterized membrane protein SpoIIM required for sporulation